MRKKYLELKKDNYLAIITFNNGDKRMVEVVADNEDDAYVKARDYTDRYCKTHKCFCTSRKIIRIPDCITVVS